MSPKILKHAKKHMAAMFWRIKNLPRKHIFKKFDDKTGLVYFGHVNQHFDEFKMVRGLTMSPNHFDDHFSVGSIGGYSLLVVDRSNFVSVPKKKDVVHNWIIFAFDLHTKTAIPHFFIGANNIDIKPFHALFTTFPNMKDIELGEFEKYDSDFISRFKVYGRPAKSLEIQKILTAEITKTLSAHLWPICVEQHDNVLYLYSTGGNVSLSLLNTMLENGLWLAGRLDKQTEDLN